MKRWLFLALWVLPLLAQSNTGELRLNVTTQTGVALKGSVEIGSDASHNLQSLLTDDTGNLAVKRLSFGVYLLEARHDWLPFQARLRSREARHSAHRDHYGSER
jgi:hypothetical protein